MVIAAVTLTKDSKVASNSRALCGDSGSRAFMSKDNHPIATNTNQAEFPIAAAAFLPKDTRMKISDITVTGEEGQDYHRRVMSLDIVPKQSILLRTLDGDTITWSLFANGGQSIFVELKDGTSFKKCAMCTPVSLCYMLYVFCPSPPPAVIPLPTSSSTHAAHLLSSSLI